jgi:hypothetical protein
MGRVAQPSDLADATKAGGAPSFAHVAKGGSRKCPLKRLSHAARSLPLIFHGPYHKKYAALLSSLL